MASRIVRNALLAASGALALALAPLDAARATTFAELSVEQFTDASDYIIRGEVQDVWTELDEHGRVWTRARVKVSETLKGPDAPEELIIDSMGGTHGAVTLSIEAQAVFSKHEEIFVFLSEMNGRLVPVSKFLGKYTIRRAPGEQRVYVRRFHPQDGLRFDARFLPHPDPEHRVYLDDLMEQVQRRLDTGWDGQSIPGISPERLERINTLQRRMPR